jgi:hypothetical protein
MAWWALTPPSHLYPDIESAEFYRVKFPVCLIGAVILFSAPMPLRTSSLSEVQRSVLSGLSSMPGQKTRKSDKAVCCFILNAPKWRQIHIL